MYSLYQDFFEKKMNNYEAHRFREILFDVFENVSFEIPKNLYWMIWKWNLRIKENLRSFVSF